MWKTSKEIQELYGISRPAVYKLALREGWKEEMRPMEHGGLCKMYFVSNDSNHDSNQKPIVTSEIDSNQNSSFDVDSNHDSNLTIVTDSNQTQIESNHLINEIDESTVNKGIGSIVTIPKTDSNHDSNQPKPTVTGESDSNQKAIVTTANDSNQENDKLLSVADHVVESNKMIVSNHIENNLDLVPDLRPKRKEIPTKYQQEVNNKIVLIQSFSKTSGISYDKYVDTYNNGFHYPQILDQLGKISARTLYRWVSAYKKEGALGLVPNYIREEGNRKVPFDIQNAIINGMKEGNKQNLNSLILWIKTQYRINKKEMPCSDKTISRWWNDFYSEHRVEIDITRQGEKYFNDHYNKSILRDWNLVEVLDVINCDGHHIEAMIIDPRDNKPKKFSLIVWQDCRSRMLLSAIVNLTENTDSILLSLRNAIVNCRGFLPLVPYTDNGKAFRSQYMKGFKKGEEEFKIELSGAYGRLGMNPTFAKPYNGQSKPIERLWLTAQEQVERCLPSFTGTNALDKPANMMRNEKLAKLINPHKPITLEEFKMFFEFWAMEIYAKTPHRGLNGRTPLEVFEEGLAKLPESRRVSLEELNYMLLSVEKRKVSKEGIKQNGFWYYHDILIRKVGDEVRLRWDPLDVRSVLVYDQNDKFICQAEKRELLHPMAKIAEDGGHSLARVNKENREKRARHKKYRELGQEMHKSLKDDSNNLLKIPVIEQSLFNNTPLIQEPVKTKNLLERVEEMGIYNNEPSPIEVTEKPTSSLYEELAKFSGISIKK